MGEKSPQEPVSMARYRQMKQEDQQAERIGTRLGNLALAAIFTWRALRGMKQGEPHKPPLPLSPHPIALFPTERTNQDSQT